MAAHCVSGPEVRISHRDAVRNQVRSPPLENTRPQNRFSRTALYQSITNTAWRMTALSPTSRTWVSRQEVELLAAVQVFLADVHAARVADFAVDDRDLAMIAVADGMQVVKRRCRRDLRRPRSASRERKRRLR